MKAGEKRRILIVEDDPHIAEGLKLNLKLQGHEATIAGNGTEGLRMWKTWNPDLIVLDIMLPGWNGLEILSELRSRGNDVPVLVLSARDRVRDKVTGLEAGADD